MRSLSLTSLLLLAGCTLADSFDYRFGDGGGAGDLGRISDGGAPDAPLALDGGAADAGPCGLPTQVCCPGVGAQQCVGGGCCSKAQRCIASGDDFPSGTGANQVCLDGAPAACGATGQPCCGRDTCASSGCCVGGDCVATTGTCTSSTGTCTLASCANLATSTNCGGLNDSCCPGSPAAGGAAIADYCVASGLACNPASGRCEQCGVADQLCCEGNYCPGGGCCSHLGASPVCLMEGASCGDVEGTCVGGGCTGCGRVGEPCCGDSIGCTAQFSTCVSSQCQSCGGRGQACCPGNNGGHYCSEPYVCNAQSTMCEHCGVKDERCCAGDTCEPGRSCQSGICG